ncbi:ethanolamine utilization protein EutH [Bacillus sp. AFS055030]|uniref:ethanolamine utilization protein EutH n=1 Tax=Bacillus sp. AFS055030 TaxID=2033507 RepID=UPI000BFD6AE8|nr:ethanolamine utilization protein EutH [Bacillus sp. AFS055030]PGL69771.1 ethanolamine utilization protein EutH [Bacillus sp. AFS055030]
MNEMILYIMTGFMVLGAIDYLMGNRYGVGQKFKEAFQSMGPLALSMLGMISLSPVLAKWLTPVVSPVYQFLGADPSMFSSTFLALDMGGYSLAIEMAQSSDAANFSWVFLGTMMGPTIVFTIPVALGIVQKKDHPFFAKGILIGLMTIPIGCLAGGFVAGFGFIWMLKNLFPSILISILIGFGMLTAQSVMIRCFKWFGKGIEIIIILGLIAIIIKTLTGFVIIPGMMPLSEGFVTVGKITIILSGAFPFVFVLVKVLKKPFVFLGHKLGMNQQALGGFIASFAHHIPMFATMHEMDDRGKVINTAFAVSGAFVFGSHLGFVAGVEKDFVLPLIVGKLTAGFLAAALALLVSKPSENESIEGK